MNVASGFVDIKCKQLEMSQVGRGFFATSLGGFFGQLLAVSFIHDQPNFCTPSHTSASCLSQTSSDAAVPFVRIVGNAIDSYAMVATVLYIKYCTILWFFHADMAYTVLSTQ